MVKIIVFLNKLNSNFTYPMQNKNQTLGEFIINNQNSFKYSSGELSRLINSIRLAAKIVNYEVNKAGLVDIIGEAGKINVQDEKQQKLDVYANNNFINTFLNKLETKLKN